MTFMTFGGCHEKPQVKKAMTFGMTFNDISSVFAVSYETAGRHSQNGAMTFFQP